MKIRDLWQRAGKNRTRPRRRGSALTNRPEVNVLDRPWITFSQRRIPLSMLHSKKKEKSDPFDIPYFVSKVCMHFTLTVENFDKVVVSFSKSWENQ